MPQPFTLFAPVPAPVAEAMRPRALFFEQLGQLVAAAEHFSAEAGRRVDWSSAELTTLDGMPGADDDRPGFSFRLTAEAHLIHVTEADAIRQRWYPVPDTLIGGWAIATADAEGTHAIDMGATDVRVLADCWGEKTARHLAGLHNAWLDNEKGLDEGFMRRLIAFSQGAFGPARRTKGLLDHIRKELVEIEQDPDDIDEWVDLVLLGLDGAWRHGGRPQEILDRIVAKLARNEERTWPDWRTASEDEAIEHDRSAKACSCARVHSLDREEATLIHTEPECPVHGPAPDVDPFDICSCEGHAHSPDSMLGLCTVLGCDCASAGF